MILLTSRAICAAACAAGLHHLARTIHRRKLLIVCYHGVTDRPVPAHLPSWHHLHVSKFTQQLLYLRRYYDVLPVDHAVAGLRANTLARPTACITFDDGYRNNLEVAFPVLRRLQLPATIYLITDWIGTNERLWSVRVEAALTRTRQSHVQLPVIGLTGKLPGAPGQRTSLARAVVHRLKAMDGPQREAVVHELLNALGEEDLRDDGLFALFDWNETRHMERSGLIAFGGHTAHHEIVSRLPDDMLQSEITSSVSATRNRVTRPSSTFAYPNGREVDFDVRARRVLQENGVTAALTTIDGLNTAETDPFELRRVTVGAGMSFAQFRAATSGLTSALRTILPAA